MSNIVTTDGVLGGAPRIEGRRIGVHHVAARVLDAGETPEQVAADYDLALADIYRALTYYYDHPAEIRTIRDRRDELLHGGRPVTQPEDIGVVPEAGRDA